MRRVLIVRACAIGDFVVNLPALRALALSQSHVRFTLVGYPAILALAKQFIPVEEIHSIESPPWSRLFAGPLDGLQFDQAYVWMKDPTVADNLRRSGIRSVFHADPFPAHGHAAEHLLSTVGLPPPELPDLWNGGDRILIQPGSGSPRKCWPYFEELADSLPEATVLLGPCEEGFRTKAPRLEGLSLSEVAEEVRNCRLFLGNDSGITHLASYLGCRAVALYGPTDPRIWGPLGRRVEVLWKSPLAEISIAEIRTLIRKWI